MLSSSFLAKLLEYKVLEIQMKFETKLRNYIILNEQGTSNRVKVA